MYTGTGRAIALPKFSRQYFLTTFDTFWFSFGYWPNIYSEPFPPLSVSKCHWNRNGDKPCRLLLIAIECTDQPAQCLRYGFNVIYICFMHMSKHLSFYRISSDPIFQHKKKKKTCVFKYFSWETSHLISIGPIPFCLFV